VSFPAVGCLPDFGALPAVGDIGGGFTAYMDSSGDFFTDAGAFIDSSGGFTSDCGDFFTGGGGLVDSSGGFTSDYTALLTGGGDFSGSGAFTGDYGGYDPQGDNVVSLDPTDSEFILAQHVPETGPDISPDGIRRMLNRLSQLQTTLVNQLLLFVQQMQQMQQLTVDPNSIETHHLLPEQFKTFFEGAGFNINDPQFLLPMTAGDHRLKPDGIHTGPFEDSYNGMWKDWILNNPMDGYPQEAKKEAIEQQLKVMKQQFEILKKYLPK
jgi:hypothetical protein